MRTASPYSYRAAGCSRKSQRGFPDEFRVLGNPCVCDLAHFVSCTLRIVAQDSVFHAFNLVGFVTRQRGTGSIRH
jgi:hypothetical protein